MDVLSIEKCRLGPNPRTRVLLISPPWRLLNWPSLAVGILKSHLKQLGVGVDGLHLHFNIAVRFGFSRYQSISMGWELGEALYFALSWPDEAEIILKKTANELNHKGRRTLAEWATRDVMAEVEQITLKALDTVDLSKYNVVGISAGALQLGASVYIAKILKQRLPTLRIVVGGGSVLGESGGSLLRHVPWIDVIVDGEGEEALAKLVNQSIWDESSFGLIPNLRYRKANGSIAATATHVLTSLDEASPPDMDEFYAAASESGYTHSDLILPVEASRGCAWEHRIADGRLHGCTFCGLYRNSPNYREKKLETVMEEITYGVARSKALEISFVDAYLPISYRKDLLRDISKANLDVTLFCELRCDLDAETSNLLARAGARHVQLGVEAFHTEILRRMVKGKRMIDNMSSIKLCEEFGVPYQYNLISRFPGVKVQELRETLQILPLLFAFKPPSIADFYLDRSSRIFADPERYGIVPETMNRDLLVFLPSSLALAGASQIVPAQTAATREIDETWDAIEREVSFWQTKHNEARDKGITQLLNYRDTGTTVLVTDHRQSDSYVLELEGILRAVLLACNRLIRRKDVLSQVEGLDDMTLDAALNQLRDHDLILEESGLLLALPVRKRLPNGSPRAWSAFSAYDE